MHAKLFHLFHWPRRRPCSLGCASLKLQMVDRSVQRPSNIAVYFTVDTTRGDPVADLTPADFHIYEDGQPVSVFESQQTILQPEVAAAHYTLLLVDMSGSVVGSPDMDKVVAGAASFAQQVGRYQKLGIYAFDGSPHVTQVVPFRRRGSAGHLARVRGIPVQGSLDESQRRGGRGDQDPRPPDEPVDGPAALWNLVVFTDGTDHAARVSRDALHAALGEVDVEVYAIAVGAEVNDQEIRAIGRNGTFTSKNPADIRRGFDEIGRASRASRGATTCCRTARLRARAQHNVEIEAVKGRMRGRLGYDFKADGFRSQLRPEPEAGLQHAHHPRTRPLPKPKTK
jgi:hypothetical protein